jgi:hypothetical protein
VHAELYKCEVNGRIEFSDRPCRRTAGETVELHYHTPDAAVSGAAVRELADTQAELDLSLERRRLERQIRTAEQRIRALRAERDRELAALRERKAQAANNLAGATWEQSISQEMAAVAQRYGDDIAVRQDDIGRMRDQLRALGR